MESVSIMEKGSKFRCQRLTHGARGDVAKRLTDLAELCGVKVSADDYWMPKGFCLPEEAQLHKPPFPLPKDHHKVLRDWWLKNYRGNRSTPNWDIASTCTVHKKKGLLLVEAKAHDKEPHDPNRDKCNAKDVENFKKIGREIQEANSNLTDQTKLQWALSHDRCYQMSNRFA